MEKRGEDFWNRRFRDRPAEKVREEMEHPHYSADMEDRRFDEPFDIFGDDRKRKQRFQLKDTSIYGEHPDSLGAEEYHGSNKRHPGLGRNNYRTRMEDRGPHREARRPGRGSAGRKRNHSRKPRYLLRREYYDYLERGQYELPFQRRGTYDPQEMHDRDFDLDERIRHLYQDEGAQVLEGPESFRKRSRRQRGQAWMDEDEYREGHAMHKRIYRKDISKRRGP